jgi:hypothetical protein
MYVKPGWRDNNINHAAFEDAYSQTGRSLLRGAEVRGFKWLYGLFLKDSWDKPGVRGLSCYWRFKFGLALVQKDALSENQG